MKANCRLCLENKKLSKSHIIPEFMYSGVYDEEPRRYYSVKNEPGKTTSRIEQKGLREYLLCKKCEALLSKYEKYADENLYGKNFAAEATITNRSATTDGKHRIYDVSGLEYRKMKLFLDSILWRILISNTFRTPKTKSTILESLRLSLLHEKELNEDIFPCIIITFFGPGQTEFLKGYNYFPFDDDDTSTGILTIIIDGFEFNFFYDRSLPESEIKGHLVQSGNMKILASSITERPDLFDDMIKTTNHLNSRFKPKKN